MVAGKHFLEGVQILNGAKGNAAKGTMWTKRGIVRLGFFIKSERAKLFRDWAEDLIIKVEEHKDLFGSLVSTPPKQLGKHNHNRLTQSRLVNILADVAKIDDKEIRLSLIQKLGL